MKHIFLIMILNLVSCLSMAGSFQLQCEFKPANRLPKFNIQFDETSAHLTFSGKRVKDSDMNPAGEKVTLKRRQPLRTDWLLYSGSTTFPDQPKNDCFIYENGECQHPERVFALNISSTALLHPGERTGSLSFTPISEYSPAESFYSHDIFCQDSRSFFVTQGLTKDSGL